jgi:hypothetical protein
MVAPLTNIAPKCQREIIESKKNIQRETEREERDLIDLSYQKGRR